MSSMLCKLLADEATHEILFRCLTKQQRDNLLSFFRRHSPDHNPYSGGGLYAGEYSGHDETANPLDPWDGYDDEGAWKNDRFMTFFRAFSALFSACYTSLVFWYLCEYNALWSLAHYLSLFPSLKLQHSHFRQRILTCAISLRMGWN